MILLDTSVWIEFLRGRHQIDDELWPRICTCGPVLQEVMAGLREEPGRDEFGEMLLALPLLQNPVRAELYLQAAEIYRSGRRMGYTIRSSVDCLIAAIALRSGAELMHRDRDFHQIARFTGLRIVN
jgi:hypothetical protein